MAATKQIHILRFLVIFLLFSQFQFLFSQKDIDDIKKQAQKAFEEENYVESYKLYSQLVANFTKEPLYNYRLGVSMIYAEPEKKKCIPYLEFAVKFVQKKEVPPEALFYLGKAYHINYRFNEATKYYKEYKQTVSASKAKEMEVDREILACENGKKLLSNIKELVILSKKVMNENEYFRSYDLSSIGGKILIKPEEFQTKLDKKKKDKSVIYLPQQGDKVFFSSYGEDGKNGRDIYFAIRLPNGTFAKPQPLTSINTPYDEDYPFLHPNGKVLYFASKGYNSMGGYDIFKTKFDETTQTWSPPENLEFPINSPGDDFLFVTDSSEKIAFFSTSRYTPPGKIHVLKIKTERVPPAFVAIKGNVRKTEINQSVRSVIAVKNIETGELVGTFAANENGEYYMELPNGGKFLFTVETPGFTKQSESVNLPVSYAIKPLRQSISYEKNVLVITNYFDEVGKDDNYLDIVEFIEKKAQLDVNEEQFKQKPIEQPIAKDNNNTEQNNQNTKDELSASNTPIPPNNTKELIDIIKQDVNELQKETQQLENENNQLKQVVQIKEQEIKETEQNISDTEKQLNSAESEEEKKQLTQILQDLKEKHNTLKQQKEFFEQYQKEISTSLENKKKEFDLNQQFLTALQDLESGKNTKNTLTKLESLQKELQALEKQKKDQSETLLALNNQEKEKQQELSKLNTQKNNLEKDAQLLQDEINQLKNEISNTKDKSLKENAELQLKEKENELKEKQNQIAIINEKIQDINEDIQSIQEQKNLLTKIKNNEPIAISNNNTSNKNNTITNSNINQITKEYETKINSAKDDTEKSKIIEEYNQILMKSIQENKKQIANTTDPSKKQKLQNLNAELERILKSNNDQLIALKSKNNIAANNNQNNINENKNQQTFINNQNNNVAISNQEQKNENNIAVNNNNQNQNNINENKNQQTSINNQNNNVAISNQEQKNENNIAVNNNNQNQNNINGNKNQQTSINNQNNNLAISNQEQKNENNIAVNNNNQNQNNINENKNQHTSINNQNNNVAISNQEQKNNISENKQSTNITKNNTSNLPIKINNQQEILNNISQSEKIKSEFIALKNQFENQPYQNLSANQNKQNIPTLNQNNPITQNIVSIINAQQQISYFNQQKDSLRKISAELKTKANKTTDNAQKQKLLNDAKKLDIAALEKEYQATQFTKTLHQNTFQLYENTFNQLPDNQKQSLSNEINKAKQYIKQAEQIRTEAANQSNLTIKIAAEQNAQEKEQIALNNLSKIFSENNILLPPNNFTETLQNENKEIENNFINLQKQYINANNSEISYLISIADTSQKIKNNPSLTQSLQQLKELQNNINNQIANSNNKETQSQIINNQLQLIQQLRQLTSISQPSVIAKNDFIKNENNPALSSKTSVSKDTIQSITQKLPLNISNQSSQQIQSLIQEQQQLEDNLKTDNPIVQSKEEVLKNNELLNTEITQLTNKALELKQQINQTTDQRKKAELQAQFEINTAIIQEKKSTQIANEILINQAEYNAQQNLIQQLINSIPSNQTIDKNNALNTISNIEKLKKQEEVLIKEALALSNPSAQLGALQNAKIKQQEYLQAQQELINQLQKYNPQAQKQSVAVNINDPLALTLKLQNNLNKQIKEWESINNQLNLEITRLYPKYSTTPSGQLLTNAQKLINESKSTNDLNKKLELQIKAAQLQQKAMQQLSASTIANNNTTQNQPINNQTNQQIAQQNKNQQQQNTQQNIAQQNKNQQQQNNQQIAQQNKNQQQQNPQQNIAQQNKNQQQQNNQQNITQQNKNQQQQNNQQIAQQNKNQQQQQTNQQNIAQQNKNQQQQTNQQIAQQNKNQQQQNTQQNIAQQNKNQQQQTITNFLPEIKSVKISKIPAYSDAKPIPLNPKLPDGLVFSVQVGAFKNPLPNDFFKGITPIFSQTTENNLYRYLVGQMQDPQEAIALKNNFRNLGYQDAFVIAYYNGKRISLSEALELLKKQKQQEITINPFATTNVLEKANIPTYTTLMETTQQNIAESTMPTIKEAEEINDLYFTIQVGVYGKDISDATFKYIKPIIRANINNKFYRYSAGIYDNITQAQKDLSKVIALGMKDAFVCAYWNGKRIFYPEAEKLIRENKNIRYAPPQPIIFPNEAIAANLGLNNNPAINNAIIEQNNNAPPFDPTLVFSNGITKRPEPTSENGVKPDNSGICFRVQIGAFRNRVPKETADKYFKIKNWPVEVHYINGLYIYTVGNFISAKYAAKLREEMIQLSITDAFITVYKDNQKLFGYEALKYMKE